MLGADTDESCSTPSGSCSKAMVLAQHSHSRAHPSQPYSEAKHRTRTKKVLNSVWFFLCIFYFSWRYLYRSLTKSLNTAVFKTSQENEATTSRLPERTALFSLIKIEVKMKKVSSSIFRKKKKKTNPSLAISFTSGFLSTHSIKTEGFYYKSCTGFTCRQICAQ